MYLAPIGSKAVLKTRSRTVTKDELFTLEDSLPQAAFVAALNSRYVSVKQGNLHSCIYFSLYAVVKHVNVCGYLKYNHLRYVSFFVQVKWARYKLGKKRGQFSFTLHKLKHAGCSS